MREFLIQFAFFGFIGFLVIAHRWWSNHGNGEENASYRLSYRRVMWHLMKWFGSLYAAVAALCAIFVVSDLLGFSKFGYPAKALPFCILMAAIGYGIRVIFKNFLETNLSYEKNILAHFLPGGARSGSFPQYGAWLNYFIQHWRGQFSISKSFWPWLLAGWLLGFLEIVVSLRTNNGLEQLAPLLQRLNLLFFIPSGIWWCVGVWRSCDAAEKKTNNSHILVKSTVVIFSLPLAGLFSWIAVRPFSKFLPMFIHFRIRGYDISLSSHFVAQLFALFSAIAIFSYLKFFHRKPFRFDPALIVLCYALVAVLLYALESFGNSWDDVIQQELPPAKDCPATVKDCNPYDTPENRAIFKK